jgi:D-proline reductase (dithiol) PrdB
MRSDNAQGLPVDYIPKIRNNYVRLGYKEYKWVVNDEAPAWKPLSKPLSECRIGLAASGGIYLAGQVAFHYKDDTSVREIPTDVDSSKLRVTHFGYDLCDARSDPNVVFPIDTFRRLAREGIIGPLPIRFLTFMGGIYSSRRVVSELAPALLAGMQEEKVDAALLVPV